MYIGSIIFSVYKQLVSTDKSPLNGSELGIYGYRASAEGFGVYSVFFLRQLELRSGFWTLFAMGKGNGILLLYFCFVCASLCLLAGSAASSEMEAWGLWESNPRPPKCSGLIGECFEDEEMLMDSEINRRILAGRKTYISYGALRSNSVPCSRRGTSYYNCRSSSQANPYRRSCTQITRCARDTS